ncbi:hypothetical protein [Variovorax paradoxus]|uniref:hypothetical protein n=1 Tax=Variovorax paradoxus TaxID=34073 RepID=UPI001ABBE512
MIATARDLELPEDDRCTDALRLLSIASSSIDFKQLGAETLAKSDPQNCISEAAFDMAALLTASLHFPKQAFGAERGVLIGAALHTLDVMTELHMSGPDGPAILPTLRQVVANPGVGVELLDPRVRQASQATAATPWGMLAQQGAHRVCEMLFQAEQSAADGWDNPAREMFSNAEELLYAMHTAELTDTLWTNQDPASAFTMLKCSKTLLRCAAAEHSAHGGLNDLQAASVPVALAMLDELLEALLQLPGDTSRLIAFADFSPAASATVPARQAAEIHEDDDEAARIKIAFDANYSMAELAKALKEHHARDASDDWPVYDGILSRIQQLSEVVYYAMRLGGTGPSVTYPSHETLQHFLDGHLGLILKDGP